MKPLGEPKARWIIALWLIGFVVLSSPGASTDPVGYYSWLRSAVIVAMWTLPTNTITSGEDKMALSSPGRLVTTRIRTPWVLPSVVHVLPGGPPNQHVLGLPK
jgi:hypothetical protein